MLRAKPRLACRLIISISICATTPRYGTFIKQRRGPHGQGFCPNSGLQWILGAALAKGRACEEQRVHPSREACDSSDGFDGSHYWGQILRSVAVLGLAHGSGVLIIE